MKKILMTSAALSALALPASAGPILDDMIGDAFTWSATESAQMDGAEIYSDLTIEGYGDSVTFASLKLNKKGGVLTAQFENMDLLPTRREATRIAAGSFSADMQLFELDPQGLEKMLNDSVLNDPSAMQDCSDLDVPVQFSAENLELYGDPSAVLSIDEVDLGYTVVDADGDCVMDMDMAMTGLSVTESNGMTLSIAGVGLDVYWSLLNARAPENHETPYTARFAMMDFALAMGGAEQFRIDEITSRSSLDPASLKGLVESGYFSAYHDLMVSEMTGMPMDFSTVSVPQIWNAIGDIVSEGDFTVSGAEITGDMAQALTGSKLLSRGRNLDMSMSYEQDRADASTTVSIESAGLLKADAKIALVLDDMDPGLAEMGPGALMMTAPVSIRSVVVALDDQGLGQILADEMGIDPYMMVEPSLGSLVGPTKAAMVAEWLGKAQSGGTVFAAAPDMPMPVMQAFAGFMGDWSRFGEMINAVSER